jgi:GT2 family glycosyltransferase
MAVRNEEASVAGALHALEEQSIPPDAVVVVDDGSTDGTPRILRAFLPRNFSLRIVTLPPHVGSNVGKPELARTLNSGLRVLREMRPELDYVMKQDSDHRLAPDYLERLLAKMQEDPRLAVASGWIEGEPYTSYAPRGSGMLVSASFWRRANQLQFPLNYGWESWVFLKAMEMGYRTTSFKDVRGTVSRRTSVTKGVLYGRGMYALGYDWTFALGRSLLFARRSPRAGLQMLRGYIDHRGVPRADISAWVGRTQRAMLLRRALGVATSGGRR